MATERLVVNQKKIAHETIDGEVIVINLETGTYYSLVESAAELWRGIENGATREQLLDALAARYAAPRAEMADAANTFLDELVREEIVVTEPNGAGTPAPILPETTAAPQPFTAPTLARYTNMADLLLLDPIHDVDEQGWPAKRAPS